MKWKCTLNLFVIAVLVFVNLFNYFNGIVACLCCLTVQWLLFGSLMSNLVSNHSRKFECLTSAILAVSVIVGVHSVYSLLMSKESDICKIGVGSCFDAGKFIFIPIQFWVLIFCFIALYISMKIKQNRDV